MMQSKYLTPLVFLFLTSCHFCTIEEINQNNCDDIHCHNKRASTSYYWNGDEQIPLAVDSSKMLVIVESQAIHNTDRHHTDVDITSKHKIVLDYLALDDNTTIDYERTSITLSKESMTNIKSDDIIYSVPYYKTEEGVSVGITNIFSVQLKNEESFGKLQEIAEKCHLNILGNNEFDPTVLTLMCDKGSNGNALEMANYIYETGLFEYASPEFIVKSYPDIIPNDPDFCNQWNLQNTSGGIDINFINAISSYTFPYIDEIIVAIVDNGVYSSHEDLTLHNVSYDAQTGTSPSRLYGSHGTNVAGIIGATSNNNKGITGIASGVKIMPVSICYNQDADYINTFPSTTSQMANAIRFAANNGAQIINNSWSIDTSTPIPEINSAITYAHHQGCIVVFSAGNSYGNILQPAAGAPFATIVVGAVKQNGYREDYSCRGSSLDVVAPGSNILTTNVNGGYSYVSGTSFSAPQVSGLAALVLGRNPNLQAWRVRDIIEQSVSKVGGNAFETSETRSNGAWNQFVGYGLIDIYKAVSSVNGQAPASPSIYTYLGELLDEDLLNMEIDPDEAFETVYLAVGENSVTAHIANYDSSVSYVWTSSLPPYYGFDSTFRVYYSSTETPALHEIKCQALKNGLSTTSGMTLIVVPTDYSY